MTFIPLYLLLALCLSLSYSVILYKSILTQVNFYLNCPHLHLHIVVAFTEWIWNCNKTKSRPHINKCCLTKSEHKTVLLLWLHNTIIVQRENNFHFVSLTGHHLSHDLSKKLFSNSAGCKLWNHGPVGWYDLVVHSINAWSLQDFSSFPFRLTQDFISTIYDLKRDLTVAGASAEWLTVWFPPRLRGADGSPHSTPVGFPPVATRRHDCSDGYSFTLEVQKKFHIFVLLMGYLISKQTV